jgi:hypothetical protein
VSADGPAVQRYLIVGNQTLAGGHLVAKVTECLAAGPSRFHLLAPATPPRLMSPPRQGEARDVARANLEPAIELFAALGADVTGEVGHESVVQAISDVLGREDFDEIIVSTLPHAVSRWLRLDVPRRLSSAFSIPVTYLVAELDATT